MFSTASSYDYYVLMRRRIGFQTNFFERNFFERSCSCILNLAAAALGTLLRSKPHCSCSWDLTSAGFQTSLQLRSKPNFSCGKNSPQCWRHIAGATVSVRFWWLMMAKNNALVDYAILHTFFSEIFQYFFTKKPKTDSGNKKCSNKYYT